MDNQHRKIAGYRELSQEEVDLMNRIKAKGTELLQLQSELFDLLNDHISHIANASSLGETEEEREVAEREVSRFNAAEPFRWAAIGKTDIQTGIMAMVRAVAQPSGI